jgi:predicted ATPase
LLLEQEVRVITLTGPGGTGKTRLSVQLGADAIDIFPDGVYFIDLSAIDQPEYLYPAIARTMGLRESGGMTFRELLWDSLRDKRMLLILDNLEQVMTASALIDKLQSACPLSKFIITSREALRIRAERVFRVSTLSVPHGGAGTPLPSLCQYDAVTLFLERASAVNADFRATNENAPAIAEICSRLEGLPLAIELAAARVDLLSPQAMLQRLGDILGLLTRGATDLPFRQRTLRAAIDWSYRLLSLEEQTLFKHLSIFSGGFTAEALECIHAEFNSGDSVFDKLSSLVAKSLVCRIEGLNGENRYSLSEPIRAYAREHLIEAGELEQATKSHSTFYLSFAEESSRLLQGPEQQRIMNMLEDDHDNLCAAFEYLSSLGSSEGQLRLCGALRLFWIIRGHLAEGLEFSMRALARLEQEEAATHAGCQSLPAAATMFCAGSIARATGDYAAASQWLQEAIQSYAALDDYLGWGLASYEYGMTLFRQGKIEQAGDVFRQILDRTPGSGGLIPATARLGLGILDASKGLYKEALEHLDESRTAFTALGNERQLAHVLGNLANIQFSLGNLDKYCKLMAETISLNKKLGDLDDLAVSFNNTAYCHACLDEHEKANDCYRELESLAKKSGNPRMLVLACTGQSDSMRKAGDTAAALHHAERAQVYAAQLGDCIEKAVSLRSLGAACLANGNAGRALQNFEKSIPLLERFMEYADKEDLEQARAGWQAARMLLEKEPEKSSAQRSR